MAILALVLWLFTAVAGFYVLVNSNLGRARPAAEHLSPAVRLGPALGLQTPVADPASQAASAASASPPANAAAAPAQAAASVATPAAPAPAKSAGKEKQERDIWAPASLVAAQTDPAVPGIRALLEFMHPACGIIGLGFWFGYTFIHYRVLGWIAVGLIAVTATLGLSWFAANASAARRRDPDEPAPSFTGRLVAVHGAGAALTAILAVISALVLQH